MKEGVETWGGLRKGAACYFGALGGVIVRMGVCCKCVVIMRVFYRGVCTFVYPLYLVVCVLELWFTSVTLRCVWNPGETAIIDVPFNFFQFHAV